MKGYKDHLAVDMDDVLLDLVGGVKRVIKKEYDIDLPEITDWNMNIWLKPILGEPWMKWMKRRAWLWSTFPAIDGAIGGLDTLRKGGFYLEIVTSKPDWAEHSVFEWLAKWRPPVHRVTIVRPEDSKADFTDANWMIDDKPQNIEEFIASRPTRHGLLFTQPHNAQIKVPKSVRVDSWRAIVDHLMKAKEE